MKLLEETIRTYKGTKTEEKVPPRVEIRVNAYPPASYIPIRGKNSILSEGLS